MSLYAYLLADGPQSALEARLLDCLDQSESNLTVFSKHRTDNVTTRHHFPTGRDRIYMRMKSSFSRRSCLRGESRAVFGFLRSMSVYPQPPSFHSRRHGRSSGQHGPAIYNCRRAPRDGLVRGDSGGKGEGQHRSGNMYRL